MPNSWWVKATSWPSTQLPVTSRAMDTAIIFGTNESVCSWICVAAWNSEIRKPTRRAVSSTGAATFAASIIVSAALKNELKFVFGRTWPETWTNNNPSLIRDGVYSFNFFRSGRAYESFPSGHTAAVCSAMSVLWLCYRRWRALCALAVLLVVIGLIGSDFHFLSDVVAGGFVGASTGWLAVLMWQAGGPRYITGDEYRRMEDP